MLIPTKHSGYKAGIRLYPGSKGGNSAPAPDPRLVEAQIRSMGIQDSVVQRIIQQSEENLPLQREQMRFGLDTARTAWEQSQQDREWSLGKRAQLDEAQRPLLDMAKNFNYADRRNEMMSEATADITQAFDSAEGQGLRTMGRMGVNPNDGRMASMTNQNNLQEALAKASAGRKVSEAARAEGIQLQSNAVNMLSGYPSMGMQATGAGAGFGASGIGITNAGAAGMNSGFNAAAGVAGQMGQNATSMYGTQSRDYYRQSGDSLGSTLGGIGGFAAGIARVAPLFSDRRLKTDIVQVGVDKHTGLNIYEFTYTSVPGRRFRGVLADEVLQVKPEAVIRMANGYDAVNYEMLGIEMVEV